MYLVYADESGDPGIPGQTEFFVISGIIVHESDWSEVFQRFGDLRRSLSQQYSIPRRIAFHACDIVNGHGEFHHSVHGLTRPMRLRLYRDILIFLSQLTQIHILNVFIRKRSIMQPMDVFEWGWQLFIQRLHNSIDTGGALCQDDDCCLLFSDRTHDDQLLRLMRRMRAFNYVPSRYPASRARRVLVTRLLDDPVHRVSNRSSFVQMADLVAYALARRDFPRNGLRPFRFEQYFDILTPVLFKPASQYDSQGIVYWPR